MPSKTITVGPGAEFENLKSAVEKIIFDRNIYQLTRWNEFSCQWKNCKRIIYFDCGGEALKIGKEIRLYCKDHLKEFLHEYTNYYED